MWQIVVVLAAMVVAYAVAHWRKLSFEFCMLASAIAGGLVGTCFSTPQVGC